MSYGKTYSYNRFDELTSEDDNITENQERKIKKKLREIEKLKRKNPRELTTEENNKIKNEDYWKNYLNPKQFSDSENNASNKSTVKHNTTEDIERKKRQLKKNKIKNKKRMEREIKQQKKLQKQLEMKRREQERKRVEQERKRREQERKRFEEERKRFEEEHRLFEINREKNNMRNEIRQDYYKLSKKCKNQETIFRKLSLKYHPDKNIDNEEWAEKMFKEFENMKAEHYENENKEEHKKKKIF